MVSQPERIILTYEDLRAIPSDRNRYEIIEGELQVTAAPNLAHQNAVGILNFRLIGHVRERDLGIVFVAPCDVYFSNTTVVEPDLLFISRQRFEILESQRVRGAPDLVVEVLSPSAAQIDRHVKRQLYARFEVPHYWIIDPDRRELIVLTLEGQQYRVAARAQNDETLTAPPPFPELILNVGELWRWG